ncbi:MAG: trypsin-like peptidase domain-containing protein [Bacteroidales bacterium]|nr:trypsin-like peptidase domain-containing protein [Bacteroidales bacterium]
MKKSLLIILAISLLGCQSPNQEAQAQKEVSSDPMAQRATIVQTDFTQVAAQTIDAVVHIKTVVSKVTPLYQSFFGVIFDSGLKQKREFEAFGSGVIIQEDGYIITNNHVVADAERVTVTLNNKRTLPARVVGTDPATDLAVIKIEGTGYTTIPFGNSDLVQLGEPVLAIGNPLNLTSTVTAGIISAKARDINIINNPGGVDSPIESFLQTDAAVNSGNSGGALVNANGELIGIIAAIASGATGNYIGYSFAIPSAIAIKVAHDLKAYGSVQRGYLGVQVAEMDETLARKAGSDNMDGVYLGRLVKGGAAEKAGLRAGDVILAVNDMPVQSYSQMMEEVGRFNPGDEVTVAFLRNGKKNSAKLVLLNADGNTQIVRKH